MTDPPTNTPTAEQLRLFDAACTGELDAEQLAELQSLLRESPELRRGYLDYAGLHTDLACVVRSQRVRERLLAAIDLQPVAPAAAAATPFTPRRKPDVWRLTTVLATAAALMLSFYLGGLGDSPTGDAADAVVASSKPTHPGRPANTSAAPSTAEEPSVAPDNEWPGLVALVSRVEGVSWAKKASRFEEADLVAAGDEVFLDEGLVELEFRQGAVVVLEGPARLVADDANGATLLSGRLAAVAPPWATGFRIDTPGVDVIDHGTEFVVSVNGDSDDPQVDVAVTEGEVEVVGLKDAESGRRLKAGEGVRANGASLDENAARTETGLTELLPDRPNFRNTRIVADRWADWSAGVDGQPQREGPWRYYTNPTQPFGDPGGYVEMVWRNAKNGFAPADARDEPWLSAYIRATREGGHPGRGQRQTDNGIDCYCITGYVVPDDGVYRIEAGWLERKWARRWDRDRVMDVAVHVNDGPLLIQKYCNRESYVGFSGRLGRLSAGDVIYVGVGPNGVDHDDKYRLGFYVVAETPPAASEAEVASLP